MLNDDLLEIFKQVQTFIGEEIVSSNASTFPINPSSCQLENENYQNDNVFDYIEQTYLKELSNEYNSILNFEDSEFIQSTESLKTDLNFENDFETNLNGSNNFSTKDSETKNGSTFTDKIIDVFDLPIDNDVFKDESFLKPNSCLAEDILRESLEECSSILNDKLTFTKSTDYCDKDYSNNLQLQNLLSCADIDGYKNNLLCDEISNCITDITPLKSVSSVNSENFKNDIFSQNLHDSSNGADFHCSKSLSCNNVQKFVKFCDKRPEPLILPRLTQFCCEFCHPKLFFTSEKDLKSHSEAHKCQFCDKYFNDLMMRTHLLTSHLDKKSHTCFHCNSTFIHVKTFRNHLRKHNLQKCEVCLKMFSKSSFKNHVPIHDKSSRFYCEYCGLDFVSKIKLNEHLSIHTNMKLYVCNICDCEFSTHGSFWIHKKWHKTPFPYKCDECGRLFRHSSVLAIHRQKHANSKLHQDQSLIESVKSKIQSQTHLGPFSGESIVDAKSKIVENSSTGSEGFLCPKMIKNYVPNPNLCKRFKISVSRISKKEHKCELCFQKFQTSTSLTIHRRKHTKERPFKCIRCSKDFPSNNSLQKHKGNINACLRWIKRNGRKSNDPSRKITPLMILPHIETKDQSIPKQCPKSNLSLLSKEVLQKHIIMSVVNQI